MTSDSCVVYLIDGTYELFRAYYGAPSALNDEGMEIAAARTLLRSLEAFLREPGVSHVAIAFDTVIESFRNELFPGYKTGAGLDPLLFAQFPLAEQVTRALGIVTWSMIDFEADDALATFAARVEADPRVAQVRIASPDKDLCQCVRAQRVVLYDRKRKLVTDEQGVVARLGVSPALVPAWLGLVGDTADGIPGVPRWGEKSAQAALNHFGSIAAIPDDPAQWTLALRGKEALARELAKARQQVDLYQRLATLRCDVPLRETLDDLRYRGPVSEQLAAVRRALGARSEAV